MPSELKIYDMTENTRKKIWVFAFEYAGIAKVGGLGEVSASQTRSLVGDPDVEIEVFMPCHGRHLDLQEKMNLSPLCEPDGEKLLLRGHIDLNYFGVNATNIISQGSLSKFQSFNDLTYFEVEVWHGTLDGASINLLVGANPIAAAVLNDRDVYGLSTLNAKLGLFAQAMREFMRFCLFKERDRIPQLIHFHDHHPLGAFLTCRQEMNLKGKDVRSIITMHLLTWPRRELQFFWKSGVNNEPLLIRLGFNYQKKRISDVWQICKGDSKEFPTLEQVGCAVADRVIAVGKNFLESDIIPYCGGDNIRYKSDFIWNGCDWDYEQNKKAVYEKYQEDFGDFALEDIKSWDFRKAFLTKILGELPPNEPKYDNDDIKRVVASECHRSPYRNDCRVDAFASDGPMVLITGRVSPQKGIENIFYAIPYVIQKIPNVHFVFLLMPTPYALDDLRSYMKFARKYPFNVRMIFGLAGSIYQLSYLAADVYCCPSRWEPFGITALEGMASRVPVVATYVGGLMESIIHLEADINNGVGLLSPNNDGESLKYALVSMLSTMSIAEMKVKDPELTAADVKPLLDNIVHKKLKAQTQLDLTFGEKIRDRAYQRVVNVFRWKIVTDKLKQIYLQLN
jgi:glycogen synthase